MARLEPATTLGAPEIAGWIAAALTNMFMRFFSVVVVLVAWELLARSGTLTPYQLPAFSTVLVRIWTDAVSGDLWVNTALTLYRALVGFAICAILGVMIGVA